jgi:hypothetical protein
MTGEDRVRAVAEFGFTERQARFLVTVLLHSGVCLLRQYTAFAGIVHGQKTRRFFEKLLRRGYATAYSCRHNRGRVYHVHYSPLYRAIGDVNSRFRRPMSAARVIENLIALDALIATPSDSWLTVPTDEAAGRQRPALGRDRTGRAVLVYAITSDRPIDVHRILQTHVPQLTPLPEWMLRIVIPRYLERLRASLETRIRHELTNPMPQFVKEVRWYFQQRRARTIEHATVDDPERYDAAEHGFAAPRYQALYERWLKDGDAALEAISSTAAGDAIKCGAGLVEYYVLSFSYQHLSLVVDAPSVPEMGAEEGDKAGSMPRPPLTHSHLRDQYVIQHPVKPSARHIDLVARLAFGAARRAERRKQGRRSVPPPESGVGTADGA